MNKTEERMIVIERLVGINEEIITQQAKLIKQQEDYIELLKLHSSLTLDTKHDKI